MNALQQAFDPLSGPSRPRNRRRNPLWRFRRFFFAIALAAIASIGAVLYTFSQTNLPEDQFDEIAQTTYICTAEVAAACGPDNATAALSTAGEDREIVVYEDLPQVLIDAVIATEDQDFFNHQGVDPRGIARAAYQFIRREGVLQGGSTITQQYVKLAFNDEDRNLERKSREAIRAIKLEQDLVDACASRENLAPLTPKECAKREILTRYLNRAYFGRGASGVQAASRAYFGKDIDELDVSESAYLAGLLRNPNGADPELNTDEANRRRTKTLELMVMAGYLDRDTAAEANNADWRLVPRADREGLGDVKGAEWGSEYFIEEVRQQLDELYPGGEIYTGGFRVYTTLDPRMQRYAYESAHMPKDENLEERDFPEMGPLFLDPNNPDDPAAAIVSVDSEGRVVSMLGGTNFAEQEFNLATSSGTEGRQPGSTMKPIGLAVAIEQGISARSYYQAYPRTLVIDEPDCDWTVSGGISSSDHHHDLIDATAYSSNIVYAQLALEIGPEQLRNTAIELGVTSDLLDQDGLVPCSLILGVEGVPVVDMAGVYSVFERDGVRLDPVLIERIENDEGKVICWFPSAVVINGEKTYSCDDEGEVRSGTRVLAPETVDQVSYAMTQVVASGGTGRRARFDEERALAGKTGTSQDNGNGWFAGYTCGVTTVIWIGHPEADIPMIDFRKPPPEDGSGFPLDGEGARVNDRNWQDLQGGNFPAMIWSDYMAKATAGDLACPDLGREPGTTPEFSGTQLNQNLTATTLAPCGYELDANGFPVRIQNFRVLGEDETIEKFRPATTTTTTAPPPPAPSQPDGLTPLQADPNAPTTTAPPPPCIAPEEWFYQANPEARPVSPAGPGVSDPNAPPAESTTQPANG